MSKELEELVKACNDVLTPKEGAMAVALEALRAAAKAVNDLTAAVSVVHREAQDCEYEPLSDPVRAHLDGCLLQRTGSVLTNAPRAAHALRMLSTGVRELEADCRKVTELAAAPEPTATT